MSRLKEQLIEENSNAPETKTQAENNTCKDLDDTEKKSSKSHESDFKVTVRNSADAVSEKENKDNNSIGKEGSKKESKEITSSDFSKTKLASISHSITDLTVKEIICTLSYIAFPVALTYFTIYLQQTIVLSFVGHKYNNQAMIEGIGVSNLYVNCFMLAIANGLVSGFDTLGANALGAKNIRLMGYYYHRALLIGYSIGTIFIVINFFVAVRLIGLLNLNEEVMHYCESYISISMFFILFDILFNLNFRYLNVVDRSLVSIIFMVGTTALHPLWCYIFINVLDLEVRGGAISMIITQFINAMLGFCYIYFFTPYPESIFCIDKVSFQKWGEFLKISVPAMFLLCAEEWSFEFLAIVAIISGELDYTLFIMGNNLLLILYSICLGFEVAVTILSGKFITQNRIALIKKIKKVSILFGVGIMLVVGGTLVILRSHVFKIFSNDPIIIEKGETTVILICTGIVFDIIQACIQGYFRGVGKHLIASLLCFLNFYVLMIGLAFLFAIVVDWGVNGIWLSYLTSIAITGIAYTFIEFSFNYEQLHNEALARVKIRSSRGVSLCEETDVEKETYDKAIVANLSTHKI